MSKRPPSLRSAVISSDRDFTGPPNPSRCLSVTCSTTLSVKRFLVTLDVADSLIFVAEPLHYFGHIEPDPVFKASSLQSRQNSFLSDGREVVGEVMFDGLENAASFIHQDLDELHWHLGTRSSHESKALP